MLGKSQVRASDEERERTVGALREHYADGRLDAGELDERVGRAYRARTRGDLDALFRDLPSERGRRARHRAREANRAAMRAHATTYAAVNGGLVGIWALTGFGEFWPIWSIAFWGAGLWWHWRVSRALRRRLERRAERRALPPPRRARRALTR